MAFQTLTTMTAKWPHLHTACYEPAAQGAVSPRDPRIRCSTDGRCHSLRCPSVTATQVNPFLAADYCGIQL